VAAGEIKQFTGKDSGFEEPDSPDLLINTEDLEPPEAVKKIKTLLPAI
jgi:adenylylsulfate kinase-like enzyme